jgi:hypothetical protein
MPDLKLGSEIGSSIRRTPVYIPDALAGERLQDSETNSYLAVRQIARCSIISKTTAVTIGGGVANDTHLLAILITKALTGTCVVTGFNDSDGAAKSLTFPAATVAGRYELNALNEAGALTVTCSNAGEDDNVAVLWMPAI